MKVFVSRKIPGTALDKLRSTQHEIVVSKFDRPLTPEEFLQGAEGADGVLSLLTDKINGDVVDAIGPQLKIISNYAVGFDNINVSELSERGIVVTNTPSDEVNEAVAEHSWALMLSLARRVVEADESVRRGAYKGWEPSIFLGKSMVGKSLGIIGLGRIGTMMARRAGGWNMRVLYNKRTRDEGAEHELGIEYAEFDTLLKESDFVSLHVPLTDETFHLMNKESFAKMKRGAYLINTARGPIIDEHDLVSTLRDGHLGGVALDVYETEPNVNPELINMENVILTPHIASATWEAREKMGYLAVDAIINTFSGTKSDNMVDYNMWEKRRI